MAMQASVLNLNEDGTPLTFQRAMKGEFQAEWEHANDQEIRKLLTTTETMRLIHKSDISPDRRGDITYYNPQVKANTFAGCVALQAATGPITLALSQHVQHLWRSYEPCTRVPLTARLACAMPISLTII
jgi:hypothetical protein